MRYLIAFFLIGFSIIGNCTTEEEIIINNYTHCLLERMREQDPQTFEKVEKFYNDININEGIFEKDDNQEDIYEENDNLKATYQRTSIEEKNTFIKEIREEKVSPLKTFFILQGLLSDRRLRDEFLSREDLFKCEVINKVIIAIRKGELGLTEVALSAEAKQNWEASLVETILLTYSSDDFIEGSNSPVFHAKPSDSIFEIEPQEKEELLKKSGLSKADFERYIQTLKDLEKEIYELLLESETRKSNFKKIPCWDLIADSVQTKITACTYTWSEQEETARDIIKRILSLPSYRGLLGKDCYSSFFQKLNGAYYYQKKYHSFYDNSFSLHDYISYKQISDVWSWIKVALKEKKHEDCILKALFLMNDKDIKNINDPEKNELIRSLFLSIFKDNIYAKKNILIALTPFITQDILKDLEKIHLTAFDDPYQQKLADDELPINSDNLILFIKMLAEEGFEPLPDEEVEEKLNNFFKNDNYNYSMLYRYILQYSILNKALRRLYESSSDSDDGSALYSFLKSLQEDLYNLIINGPSEKFDITRIWWKYIIDISLKRISTFRKKEFIRIIINDERVNPRPYFYEAIEEPDLLQDIIDSFPLTDDEIKDIYEKNRYNHLKSILDRLPTKEEKRTTSLHLLQKHGVDFSKLNLDMH